MIIWSVRGRYEKWEKSISFTKKTIRQCALPVWDFPISFFFLRSLGQVVNTRLHTVLEQFSILIFYKGTIEDVFFDRNISKIRKVNHLETVKDNLQVLLTFEMLNAFLCYQGICCIQKQPLITSIKTNNWKLLTYLYFTLCLVRWSVACIL